MIPLNAKENHFQRYIQYASFILSHYNVNEPFHLYLKRYFSKNKKHGSRDRKLITSLCYNYFRLGCGVSTETDKQQKFLLGNFLCERTSSAFLAFLKPAWNDLIGLSLEEKIELIKNEFDPTKVFPFLEELSGEINQEKFNLSFLVQPKLFIRIRPGHRETVIKKLQLQGFSFEEINKDCIAFSNNEKLDDIININKEAVIQDYNSQKVAGFFELVANDSQLPVVNTWDCCAASGGKSILAYDTFENIKLTVSDKRKSILTNLAKRFEQAGIKNYHSVVTDLSVSSAPMELQSQYDLLIADVPCSGSGTWSRTPEQLSFFKKSEIDRYAFLQKKIIENTVMNLKPGGYYLYITCSVFAKENEQNVAFMQEKFSLNLLKMEYLKGYEMQADTLFAALLKR
jgi:16S rRNA (cytosine967-C5)-methyltransferase